MYFYLFCTKQELNPLIAACMADEGESTNSYYDESNEEFQQESAKIVRALVRKGADVNIIIEVCLYICIVLLFIGT